MQRTVRKKFFREKKILQRVSEKHQRGSQLKAEVNRKAEFIGINEHSELIFDVKIATQVIFQGFSISLVQLKKYEITVFTRLMLCDLQQREKANE